MALFSPGDLVTYNYNPKISGMSVTFHDTTWIILKERSHKYEDITEYLVKFAGPDMLDPTGNSPMWLKENRFIPHKIQTKEEKIINKIKILEKRHKEFIENRNGKSSTKARSMSTVQTDW